MVFAAATSFCQPADLLPGRPFGVSFRSCGFEVLVYNVRFPRVFEHFFSVVFVRSRCCVDFCLRCDFALFRTETRGFAVF